MNDLLIEKTAVLSECGTYRYRLTRKWGNGKRCGFIMLNPSTADATVDDPTIRRCMRFARDWGCAELVVVNLFAYRATNPQDLYNAVDPIGPDNMEHVKWAVEAVVAGDRYGMPPVGPLVCAWGAHGDFMDQDRTVRGWIESCGVEPTALAFTKGGQPRHPLYLKADLTPTLAFN